MCRLPGLEFMPSPSLSIPRPSGTRWASAPYFTFRFAETCVFVTSRLAPFLRPAFAGTPSPELRGQFAGSLTTLLLLVGSSSHLCRFAVRAPLIYLTPFSPRLSLLPYSNFSPLRPGLPTPGTDLNDVSVCLNHRRLRNINRMCIDYAFRPRLSSRLTRGGRTFPRKP